MKLLKQNVDEIVASLSPLGSSWRAVVDYQPEWNDILAESVKSMQVKAVRGQKHGRGLEVFAETIVSEVFGHQYETHCKFTGASGEMAKCDFALPNKELPRILITAKVYVTTGSKMTDDIGDLNSIIRHKPHDTTLLLFTDGLTWNRRLSDLDQIVRMQNRGEIARIYTTKMADVFRQDLLVLKEEYQL